MQSVSYGSTNTAIDSLFSSGTYTFNIQGPSSNQTVMVVLSNTTAMPMPNAPHVSNYAAAQAIHTTNAFTLVWDAMAGGTPADYISVDVQPLNQDTDLLENSIFGTVGALDGTATSAVIPANTLQTGSNYNVNVQFTRIAVSSNSTYATSIDRTALTILNLATLGNSTRVLAFTNLVAKPSSFAFDVLCTAGQTFTVLTATNLYSPSNTWQALLTTNPTGSQVHVIDSRASTNKMRFYRAKNGS